MSPAEELKAEETKFLASVDAYAADKTEAKKHELFRAAVRLADAARREQEDFWD